MALVSDIVSEARGYLQDTDAGGYRFSDADLLLYLNDAIKLMTDVRPELFTEIVTFSCVAGTQQQLGTTVGAVASSGLFEVIANDKGEALREMDMSVLDRFRPGWANDTYGSAQNWARQNGSKYIFYVYPGATAGLGITLSHVSIPVYTLLGNTIDGRLLPYTSAIAEYMAGAVLMRDQEGSSPNDSLTFKNSFVAKIGAKK